MTTRNDHVGTWLDWCAATGGAANRPTWRDVEQFLRDVPVAGSTQTRRLGALRAYYRSVRIHLVDAPTSQRMQLWPTEADSLPQTLARTVSYGWPDAVRGRRDAVILLLAHAGLNRREIAAAPPACLEDDGVLLLMGVPLPRDRSTYRCAACAASRWLRVLDHWTAGDAGIHVIEEAVATVPSSEGHHDCLLPLDELTAWRHATRLVCSVSGRGHLVQSPVGLRSVTTALRTVRDGDGPFTPVDTGAPTGTPRTSPPLGPTPAERAPALRELDLLLDALDASLARQERQAIERDGR